MKRICVFCGSRHGVHEGYTRAARQLGAELGERGLGLVYGGGTVGLMGEVARAALAAGAPVTGVIPRALAEREGVSFEVGDLRVVGSMHERKALMAELADGFIALPGGLGTLEELFEVLTWSQLGFHHKPCGLLDVDGYYDPLVTLLDHMTAEGFVREPERALLITASAPGELLGRLLDYQPPEVEHWLDRRTI